MRALNFMRIVTLAGTVAMLAACGGLPDKTDETVTWHNDKLYSEAKDALDSQNWAKCAQYYDALEARDPFGRFAQQAEINVAYCRYRNNDTDEANAAVDRFIKLHPDHPNVDYAYYLKGLINFNDDLGLFGRFSGQDLSDRDPQSLHDSYTAFKQIVDRYPKSQYAPDAAQRMRYIVNALATHEVHAAEYYYRRGAYVAAVNRAQTALQTYQGAPATEDALKVMEQSYRALGENKLADDTHRVWDATFAETDAQAARNAPHKKPWYQIW